MSIRLFEAGENSEEIKEAEAGVYCTIYCKDFATAFFIRRSEVPKVEGLVDSVSKSSVKIDYIQRVYNPASEEEGLTHGSLTVRPSDIVSVMIEEGDDFPEFYL